MNSKLKNSEELESNRILQITKDQHDSDEIKIENEKNLLTLLKIKCTGFFFSILASITAVISNVLIKKTTYLNG